MRKIKEVLRLEAEGLSSREIARSLKLGRTTVQRYRDRAARAGLSCHFPGAFPRYSHQDSPG